MPKRRSPSPPGSPPLFPTEEAGRKESSISGEAAPREESGLTGGPATAHGLEYQLKIALNETYQMMAEVLAAPFKSPTITLEPRNVQERGVTRWDIRRSPPKRLLETKLSVSRDDIFEWLERIHQSHDDDAEFRLVSSRAGGALESSLSRLIKLAHEFSLDEQRFLRIYQREQIKEADAILKALGEKSFGALRRMSLRQSPEEDVADHITFMARMLCPSQAVELTWFLHEELLASMQNRTAISIRELLEKCQAKAFDLIAPQAIVRDELAPPLRAALALLRYCKGGVPTAVLAQTVQCSEQDVQTTLAPLIEGRNLALDGERWRLLGRAPNIQHEEEQEVLERGLKALLRYIDEHNGQAAGRAFLLDAVQLTRFCARINPPAVIRTFRPLEKLLKRHGNKHLVLELGVRPRNLFEREFFSGTIKDK